jgi:CTP-dependent riboflavin kinase
MSTIEVTGIVVSGRRMAGMWMHKDMRLYVEALKIMVHPGTLNIRVEDPRLGKQLLIGGECVDPGYIRGMRKMVVRDCTVNGTAAFVVRHQVHPDGTSIVEIAGPSIAGIKPEAPVAMTLDIEGPPRLITVSSR